MQWGGHSMGSGRWLCGAGGVSQSSGWRNCCSVPRGCVCRGGWLGGMGAWGGAHNLSVEAINGAQHRAGRAAVLCCAVLCCAVLCCAVLCCAAGVHCCVCVCVCSGCGMSAQHAVGTWECKERERSMQGTCKVHAGNVQRALECAKCMQETC